MRRREHLLTHPPQPRPCERVYWTRLRARIRRVGAGRPPLGEACTARAPRNPLGPAQVCPEVSGPGDAREGAAGRPCAAPAQHSAYAGGPGRCPRNCAGALRPALRGGVSLRRAQDWGKTRAGIGRGAARRDVPRVGPDGACALRGRRGSWGAGRGQVWLFPSLSPGAAGTSRRLPAP